MALVAVTDGGDADTPSPSSSANAVTENTESTTIRAAKILFKVLIKTTLSNKPLIIHGLQTGHYSYFGMVPA